MKVELERSFEVPASPESAWRFLREIEAVAACVPGARITERLDDTHFKGTMTVKMGPATMSFRGDVEVREIDPAAKSLRLIGKGTDSTGTSGATMDLTARIDSADGDRCTLVSRSEVSMSGKAAAFGGRMMNSVADQIVKQFAGNFAAQVAARTPPSPGSGTAAGPAAGPAGTATEAQGVPDTGVATSAEDAPHPIPVPAAETRPLNALALAWAIFKDWLKSVFSGKKA